MPSGKLAAPAALAIDSCHSFIASIRSAVVIGVMQRGGCGSFTLSISMALEPYGQRHSAYYGGGGLTVASSDL